MKRLTLKSFVFSLLDKGETVTDQKVCNFLKGGIPNFKTVEEYKRQYFKNRQRLEEGY